MLLVSPSSWTPHDSGTMVHPCTHVQIRAYVQIVVDQMRRSILEKVLELSNGSTTSALPREANTN